MFKSNKKRATQNNRNFGAQVLRYNEYPNRLNFYLETPNEEITIEEFENWAISRLCGWNFIFFLVLSEIESGLFRNRTLKEIEVMLKPLIEKHLPLSSNISRSLKGSLIDEERKKDHYSHYILKLAFCRSEELRKRFVRAETALFKLRFLQDDAKERLAFINSLNFDWEMVSEDEKKSKQNKLADATQKNIEKEIFFKERVDFDKVCDLVEKRKVFLEKGKAYVPISEQISLISEEFSSRLEKSLELTARILPRLDEDDRLLPILNHLSLGFTAPEYTSTISGISDISASQIDSLIRHFPLCQRNLHLNLRKDKHLKHFGRLQYGLFLKGIGLDIEEALVFWRKSFSNMTDERFNKEYKYNVRHSYGLEGNRRNYKPYSCQQILTGPQPGTGDSHGCPFRHFSIENLNISLENMGIHDSKTLKEINDAVIGRHYHIACTKVFEFTHPSVGILQESISHPNQYFDYSYALIKDADKNKAAENDKKNV
ncbi:hypothetical protein PORY_001029 [Pneumocystis oryctolagi]|uniref:Uncharacterized protein n=1 Tax=Pneumocystis oryctolagi TaxID=42067 RepID=A0ACB7CD20_9ASCO|nr:hypothetical protein PORY_001029 [Pneumocystis oryctolagi]